MKVRSMGVGRVWDGILCAYVSEEGGDGEGVSSEEPSLLSYTLRYVRLTEVGSSVPVWVVSTDAPVHV
jgi:hypothetical protein